ncbi:MAG: CoB--CoM heterodisulfide reductase iron-sulfur subunit A family protein [Deltaproteobacteria bacterium]|nr:CoB--CoM heterodisulfide reductase iron-sulfur subunit A family protein [Deltaproteobacteria bacterium]
MNKRVLVVGGGIAGLTAAWELSKFNINVILVEKTCFLGGHAIQFCCKATDECLTCGACSAEEMLQNVVNEPGIQVHLATEIKQITKNDGYSVSLKQSALPDDQNAKGIIKAFSKNNSPLYVITDKNACSNIPEGAVEFNELGFEGNIDVDAIILASGFKTFDAGEKGTYGYGKFKNIVTGLDLERIKRENGFIVRPSDNKEPQKIAFIQCVGSRDENLGNLWCSQVCCPYALRMARGIKFRNPDADITIFYMDIQNAGKNAFHFYDKCKEEFNFIRNIPVDLYPMEGDKLRTRYLNDEDGSAVEDVFDMVALSVGITPGSDNKILSETLGIDLDIDGFFACTDKLNRTSTLKDGIFIAGTVQGPKSIPASMAHASQAAGEVLKHLGVSG